MSSSKTIGIIGTRKRDSIKDFKLTKHQFLKIYNPNDSICSGLCPQGGDWFAVLISLGKYYISDKNEKQKILNKIKSNKIKYKIQPLWFPADWERHSKGAGFIRNTDIAKNSDILIAVVSDDRKGGTEDTIKKFLRFNKPPENLILI